MKNLINFMVRVRKQFNLFTIQEAAYNCKCSEMTIRNFENAMPANANGTILCFYIAEILFKCDITVVDELVYLIKEARNEED